MPITPTLAAELRRLSPRQKATLADHLWHERQNEKEATEKGVRCIEDVASGKVRGLSEKSFRRSLSK